MLDIVKYLLYNKLKHIPLILTLFVIKVVLDFINKTQTS